MSRMKSRGENFSFRTKLTLVFLMSTLIIFFVNMYIFGCINTMMQKVNNSYYTNTELMQLQTTLGSVRDNLKEYMNSKSSDAMEDYYRSEQNLEELMEYLNDEIYADSTLIMEKNINEMSRKYIETTSQVVEAKRGRNVDEYTEKYEISEKIYNHIYTYIYSLNASQFQSNTVEYESMIKSLNYAETVSIVIMVLVGIVNIFLILVLTANIIDPLESYITNARLKYLQAQVNPHFLFNTLNAGAQLAMLEEADRTYEYIQNVAEFFRYNLKSDMDATTIGEEINLVDNYLYILNVRFANEIIYEKEIDENLLDVEVPAMIIQPIVENAVNHGLKNSLNEKKITLRVYQDDDSICISISDNGKGISKEKIQEIMEDRVTPSDEKTDSNGIGINNVINRLKIFYMAKDVIEITSEGEDMGTEMVLYIPTEYRS